MLTGLSETDFSSFGDVGNHVMVRGLLDLHPFLCLICGGGGCEGSEACLFDCPCMIYCVVNTVQVGIQGIAGRSD